MATENEKSLRVSHSKEEQVNQPSLQVSHFEEEKVNKTSLRVSHCEEERRGKLKQSDDVNATHEQITSAKKPRNDVPKLRFKEFDGEWEQKKLGDIGKVKMCKRVFSKETNEVGEIPFYKIGTFGKQADAYITKKLYLSYKEKFSFPKIGDILMSASGTLGRTVIYNGVDSYFQDSNIVWIDNNENLVTNKFLYYIYQIVKYDSEGGTIQRLYNNIISSAKFTKPKLPEQQKIANFLTAVDTKLQQLSTKKEKLTQYKKGVMQQLFSQQLRFKPNVIARHEVISPNETEFPDWEEMYYDEIFSFYSTNSFSRDNLNYERGKIKNIHYGDIHTKFSMLFNIEMEKVPFINEAIDLSKIKAQNYCQIGDLIIADASENYSDIGKSIEIINLNNNPLLAGLHTFLARPNKHDMEIGFSSYLMQSWNVRKQIMTIAQGTKVLSLSTSRLGKVKVNIPSLKEQQKIANYLSAMDAKIATVQTQITKTQQFKKGLLQQMFV